ncbi:MAG TPA: hypothetical protein VJY41_02370, partial [Prolixibacteraceae bacterium]|nr:hypothetical protein [Prolixibacteraceae bacterium]
MNKLILSMKLMTVFVIALFMLTFIGCTPEESEWPQGKEIFEKPPWLGGTNIETLEKDSLNRYSIFLELME